MKVGVIVAVDQEYREMLKLLGGKPEGEFGRNTVILRQSGIGKVNAALRCQDLIKEADPDCIISTGVAGGLGESLKPLDVVVSSEIVYHDVWCGEGNEYGQVQGLPARFAASRPLYDCAVGLGGDVHGGLICTGDIFAGHEDMVRVKEKFPEGMAIDMESGALAQTCYINGKPFVSFRVISDTLSGNDNWNEYDNFWKEVGDHSFRMIRDFLLSLPEKI